VSFCNIWAEPPKEADFETIQGNLNDLRARRHVDFTGGEPLLRSDVGQIYTEAKNRVLHQHDDEHDSLSKKKRGKFRVGGLLEFLAGWSGEIATSRGGENF